VETRSKKLPVGSEEGSLAALTQKYLKDPGGVQRPFARPARVARAPGGRIQEQYHPAAKTQL